ncbi:hypothetical protein [Dehalobacter sp. TeCB1]|uniref:hypothetical protein n=1 Tax=Dehalobacter sp. TeCB1 TaxID=1843715 RepID=UPI00083A89EB|nr:hypothetical protein [Dehalobacter sp. TeCB1]OCZ51367.1 hypothetical protein A7D23_13175 [Dehalobacter sp. TeCB1]
MWILKKILIIPVIIIVLSVILSCGIFIWTVSSVMYPALNESDIKLTDFIFHSKDIDSEKMEKLKEIINAKGSQAGKDVGQYLGEKMLEMFPGPASDKSSSFGNSQPPDIDDVMNIVDSKADEGFQKGLDALDKMDKAQNDSLNSSLD